MQSLCTWHYFISFSLLRVSTKFSLQVLALLAGTVRTGRKVGIIFRQQASPERIISAFKLHWFILSLFICCTQCQASQGNPLSMYLAHGSYSSHTYPFCSSASLLPATLVPPLGLPSGLLLQTRVCKYVCMYVCACMCMYVCACVCACACMCVTVCACKCVPACVNVCVCVHVVCLVYQCAYACVHMCAPKCSCVCVSMCVHICVISIKNKTHKW